MGSAARPAAACLLVGILLGLSGWADPAAVAAVSLPLAAAVALLLGRGTRRAAVSALALAAACLGVVRGAAAQAARAGEVVAQELAVARGIVVAAGDPPSFDVPAPVLPAEVPDEWPGRRAEQTVSFRIAVDAFARARGPPPELLVHVRCRAGDLLPPLLPGDRVEAVGRCAPVRPPRNPGEADRRARLGRQGVVGELYVDAPGGLRAAQGEPGGALLVSRIGERIRRVARDRIRAACADAPREAGLFACLLLGDREGIDDATLRAFRDSGTAHLLSVSGLHVVLLMAALAAAARTVAPKRMPRGLEFAATLTVLVGYAAACRFATPVVRACVFLSIARAARAVGRRAPTLDCLAVAACGVLVVEPSQAVDPGFQLSFVAVAGLALLTRPFREALFSSLDMVRRFRGALPRRQLRVRLAIARAVCAALAASVATAPVAAAHFGRLQPVAPLANVATVPWAGFLLPLAAGLAIVGDAAPTITAPLARFGAAPLRGIVEGAAALPLASSVPGAPGGAAVTLSCLLLAVGVRLRPWRRRHLLLPLGSWLVLAAAPALRNGPTEPDLVVLDVGHGVCAVLRAADGTAVLFDAGGRTPALGDRLIVPALRALGVRRLAAVVVSHEDSDHCGAVADVVRTTSVDEVLVPVGFGADAAPREVLALCRERGVPVVVVARGDVWRRAGLELRVLHPTAASTAPADNGDSAVVHVTAVGGAGTLSALLPGDLEGAPLRVLSSDPTAPPARVLVLPHHGRGDPGEHLALAARCSAEVLVASTSAAAPPRVPGARVTGLEGALRIRASGAVETWPWD